MIVPEKAPAPVISPLLMSVNPEAIVPLSSITAYRQITTSAIIERNVHHSAGCEKTCIRVNYLVNYYQAWHRTVETSEQLALS